MLDQNTPQLRALVKTVLFVLSILVATVITITAIMAFGIESVGLAISVLILGFFVYMAYTFTLAQEQYRDKLKDLQSTIRGE